MQLRNCLWNLVFAYQASAAIYHSFDELKQNSFDFVIVGGGVAGNVLANRLPENPFWSVLVIEAGGPIDNVTELMIPAMAPRVAPNTRFDWNFSTTPQTALNNRSIPVARGFALGGSSSINFMVYTRGPADDFNRLASITGDEGWSWKNILPYIAKNENFNSPANGNTTQFDPSVHSFTGINSVSLAGFPHPDIENRVIQATQESAEFPFRHDMNSGNHLGIGWTQETVKDGKRSSSAVSYLGPQFIGRPNLNVLVNARVTRLLTREEGSVAFTRVELTQDAGNSFQQVTATKEIILSARSLMSPHVLLHSGIGDSEDLTTLGIKTVHHLPSVGKNLTEHPFVPNSFQVNSNNTPDNAARDPALAQQILDEWTANKTGPLVDAPPVMIGWLRANESHEIFDRFGDPSAGNNSAHFEFVFGRLYRTHTFSITGGTLRLNTSNPLDNPLIDYQMLSSEFDRFILREAIRSARRLLSLPAWNGFILSATTNATTDEELDQYFAQNARGIAHPVSTAAMSPRGASWGVVDPDFKVKGVGRLRVVDASTFPKIPTAHTQAPTYILAERAADLIKETWFGDTS
ncbi:hypothetical protein V5O48_008669 [Marasmius crinis-equi]|uniref:Aryl-alcohol oxidase n=1 Tax=Marasmius crinis-equi TaxID=585013 RepID=A0ABR3FDE6_9AGAR